MKLVSSLRAAVVVVGITTVGMASVAQAEELTESHVAEALKVVRLTMAKNFENLLSIVSQQVQNNLIRARPDQHAAISDVVDAEAQALVPRRLDLDNDVARVWAKYFTEDELKAIATFYTSPAGAKLAAMGPEAIRDSAKSVDGWRQRVGEEMLQKSTADLKKRGVEF